MSLAVLTAVVTAIMFFASLTRSTFGFGEALVAMPLLTLVLPVETVTALVAINSICNSVLILGTAGDKTDWRGGWRLIVSSIIGIPVGVYLLTHVPAVIVKSLLALVILLFAVYGLSQRRIGHLGSDRWAFPFGFVGGMLSGAYNTAGPAMVIYGSLRGWTPSQFRSTLQGVFLPNAAFVLLVHYFAGLWSSEVFHYAAFTVPLLLITVPTGYLANRTIHPEHFQRLLYGILIILAGTLLFTTLYREAQ